MLHHRSSQREQLITFGTGRVEFRLDGTRQHGDWISVVVTLEVDRQPGFHARFVHGQNGLNRSRADRTGVGDLKSTLRDLLVSPGSQR